MADYPLSAINKQLLGEILEGNAKITVNMKNVLAKQMQTYEHILCWCQDAATCSQTRLPAMKTLWHYQHRIPIPTTITAYVDRYKETSFIKNSILKSIKLNFTKILKLYF